MLFSAVNRTEPSLPWLSTPGLPNEDRSFLSAPRRRRLGPRHRRPQFARGGRGRQLWRATSSTRTISVPGLDLRTDDRAEGRARLAVGHFYGIGPATLKYGAEGTIAAVDETTALVRPRLGAGRVPERRADLCRHRGTGRRPSPARGRPQRRRPAGRRPRRRTDRPAGRHRLRADRGPMAARRLAPRHRIFRSTSRSAR